jgi:NAD(P)-dependent dehydrogenase (short-subunit alcohol dehydrogenase family)
LAGAGFDVIAGARSFVTCPGRGEDDIFRIPLDVTDQESIRGFVKKALQHSPRVDVLVNCAAILVLGPCEETSRDEYENVFKTNFLGTVSMIQAALPVMRKQHSGKIINFSSLNGLFGVPFQSAYTATKHAIEGYSECLAMETASFGVQICLVEPGDHKSGSSLYRLHAQAQKPGSPYEANFQQGISVIARDEEDGSDPEKLGRKIAHLAQRKRMPLRFKVIKPLEYLPLLLHLFLPGRFFLPLLSMYYHLGKGDTAHEYEEENDQSHLRAQ